jgi:hypothetical protein
MQMAAPCPEYAHASARPAVATPTPRLPHPRQQDDGETDVLSSSNGPSTVAQQQRCHCTSASARSPSWPPMPRPRLQRAASVRQKKIQLPIAEQNFFRRGRTESSGAMTQSYVDSTHDGNPLMTCAREQGMQTGSYAGWTANVLEEVTKRPLATDFILSEKQNCAGKYIYPGHIYLTKFVSRRSRHCSSHPCHLMYLYF